MHIIYNGQSIEVDEGITLGSFLTSQGLDPNKVVAERNTVIVPTTDFGITILQADDILEVLHFVGGG